MSVTVNMPQLGESVTEGTVTRWLKAVGDQVTADEPLLEVSTDKVDTEVPAPESGVLLSIAVNEDETVPVGAPLAVIGTAEEAGQAGTPPQPTPLATAPAPQAPPTPIAPPAATQPPPATVPAAPAAAAPLMANRAPEARPSDSPAARVAEGAPSGHETPVILPALGESVMEGTVTRWLKAIGDEVTADEALLEVSTDKVDTEIPAPASGILLEIRVADDETAEVGQTIGIIGDRVAAEALASAPAPEPELVTPAPPSHAVGAVRVEAPRNVASPQPAATATPAPGPNKPASGGHATAAPTDMYVTPLVRRIASENKVDLTTIRGTGVGGRITKQDVFDAAHGARIPAAPTPPRTPQPPTPQPPAPQATEPQPPTPAAPQSPTRPAATRQPAVAEAPTPAPARADASRPPQSETPGSRTEPLSRLRKVIAQRMVASLQVSAQLTTVLEADLTRVATMRAKHRSAFEAREGIGLSFMPFFAKASIEALRAYPIVNASIDEEAGTVTYHDAVHLGIAVDTPRGLLVPVVRDAQDLTIPALNRKIADVAARTRENRVTPDELSGGTFTLTNTGSRGALFDTPIINQPQVAILGIGAMVRRPVVVPDEYGADSIAIRTMVFLALTYDHRLVDGADAARFLSAVKARLEGGDFGAELA